MEHRIQGARAHLVTVVLQLLDHAQPKDWFSARMVENVDTDQARQQLLIPDVLDLSQSHI